MFVVGAEKLRAFWEKRPDAEAPLRALHAVLSEGAWGSRKALLAGLGAIAEPGADGEIELALDWCGARVKLQANCAAGIVLIERVTRSE